METTSDRFEKFESDSDAHLPPAARRQLISDYLRDFGSATVGRLAGLVGVSTATIHRDLKVLEAEDRIRRVRGGASYAAGDRPQRADTDFDVRLRHRPLAKLSLAVEARKLIEPRTAIFLDASTTCLALAIAIEHDPLPLTLITNSPAIGYAMHSREVDVVMVPGHLDQGLRMVGGRWAQDFISSLNISTVFMSGAGVSVKEGITTTRQAILDSLTAAMKQANRRFGLIESRKFGEAALLSVCDLDFVDGLVTDGSLDPSIAEEYASIGVDILTPREESVRLSDEIARTNPMWARTFGSVASQAPD